MFNILNHAVFIIFLSCLTISVYSQEADMEKEVFKVVEEMPRFPGCEHLASAKEKEDCARKQMMNYIYNHLTYPMDAILKHTTGQVVIQFIIEKDSSIKNIEVTREIGNGCGQAAMKVVESMNFMAKKWRPGYHKGKPVRVSYTLPVKFSEVYHFSDVEKSGVTYIPVFSDCEATDNVQDAIKCNNRELKTYISDNLKYPDKAYNSGVEGMVRVGFIITKDGKVNNINILNSLTEECDQEVIQVIRSMNDLDYGWEAATLNNQQVNFYYTHEVEFNLMKEKIKRSKK